MIGNGTSSHLWVRGALGRCGAGESDCNRISLTPGAPSDPRPGGSGWMQMSV